jgi:hypothetical protein
MNMLVAATLLSIAFADHQHLHDKRQTIVGAQNLAALPFVKSDLPPVETGCMPGDIVPPNWQANKIDEYISNYPGFGQDCK